MPAGKAAGKYWQDPLQTGRTDFVLFKHGCKLTHDVRAFYDVAPVTRYAIVRTQCNAGLFRQSSARSKIEASQPKTRASRCVAKEFPDGQGRNEEGPRSGPKRVLRLAEGKNFAWRQGQV